MTWGKKGTASERLSLPDELVIVTRELPGNVITRSLRSDVFEDALRAAETVLRAQKRSARAAAAEEE